VSARRKNGHKGGVHRKKIWRLEVTNPKDIFVRKGDGIKSRGIDEDHGRRARVRSGGLRRETCLVSQQASTDLLS